MKDFKSHKITCECCGHVTRAMLNVKSDESFKPGDIIICAHCARPGSYQEDGTVKALTNEALYEIQMCHPEAWVDLWNARAAILNNPEPLNEQ